MQSFSGNAASSNAGHNILDAIFGASSFLTQLITRDPVFTHSVLTDNWQATLCDILTNLKADCREAATRNEIMSLLRRAKARLALTLALADIAEAIDVMKVTAYLTHLADISLEICLLDFFDKGCGRR